MKVEFFKHDLGEIEINSVIDTLYSNFLTSGPKTEEFEKAFASYLGTKYAVGVTSCTAALFLSMKALNIGKGDEVITTPLTFAATISSIIHTGATPVLVDVDHKTGNINLDLIEHFITNKTKAIIPVHLYGNMCDIITLNEITDRYGLYLIEDAAHCIEGEYAHIKPGVDSQAACFSFYTTKNITCGEGGAIATNDLILYNKCKKLRCHGINKSVYTRSKGAYYHWDIDELGYKFNMDDIKASLLLPQLNINKIDNKLNRRQIIYNRYIDGLKHLNVRFPLITHNQKSALHLFTVWVHPNYRNQLLTKLAERNIGVGVHYRPVNQLSYFRPLFPHTFPSAEKIGSSTISLPFYPSLMDEEIDYVIQSFEESYREIN